jgi:hypothetical protein
MTMTNPLHLIQSELKAPKSQVNNFGKYRYRSCEDIVEAVKPILVKYSCSLVVCDDIVQFGDRLFVKATARILASGTVIAEASAFAEHASEKKGMDAAQVTGATSSYARKYALNGLLAIDDTKDADATNTHDKHEQTTISDQQASELAGMIDELDDKMDRNAFLKFFKISGLSEMKASDFAKAKAALEKRMQA